MRKLFLLSMICGITLGAQAQVPKNYSLTLIAEGNFGTPNGDIYKTSRVNGSSTVQQALFRTANNMTTGIDVLQDFDYNGNKAILCGKGAQPLKLAVVNYPAMDTVFTVSSGLGAGIQRCGMVSPHKAYLFPATGAVMRYVDIDNQTIGNVSDPNSYFSNGVHSMIGYNNAMYVAYGNKVVKIDTLTQTAVSSIAPGITAINTMVKDTANNCLWLLGKSGTTNALVKISVNNGDAVGTPILLTGFTNAKLLRVGPNKLYFVSTNKFYIYDLANPVVPTTPIHTSILPGSTASLMYDRSFIVDPLSGDFAYASAGNYVAPGYYAIVNGTDSSIIDTGNFENAAIPNELFLRTWPVTITPTWDTTSLPQLFAECAINLIAPTANYGAQLVVGTTDSMMISGQGNHTVTWKYVSGTDSITQVQYLTIADTSAPVPDMALLFPLSGICPYTLIPPTATDNCEGSITGTTDSLTFNTAGNYTITWTYTDSLGNSRTQEQLLTVTCEQTGILKPQSLQAKVYPNPADQLIHIAFNNKTQATLIIYNLLGQKVWSQSINAQSVSLETGKLSEGIYMLELTNSAAERYYQKIIIKH